MAASVTEQPLVRMSGVDKRFGSVQVLQDVGLRILAGEVHVLAGENGAGKSTLIKILAGVHTDFQGTIEIDGRTVRPESPLAANALGVAVIYQELSLVPSMSVADNIFLGRPCTNRAGLVDDRAQASQARRLLSQLGLELDVNEHVEQLAIGTQQLIEIAKALSYDAKVIVMDEPTSALTAPEVERLFALIDQLKAQGCGIVYITHKMEEIERIADRITVLRDGRLVGSAPAQELPPARLVQWMVGREVDQQFPRHVPHIGQERLRVEDFTVEGGRGAKPVVDRVGFSVRAGEILGIGGLQGSGASELLLGLFGAYGNRVQGRVWLNGKPVRITRPRQAIDHRLAMLTNDRKATGLVLSMSVIANATLGDLRRLAPRGWRSTRREREVTAALAESLQLRAASLEMDVAELSGGNQQKVALAKWLQTDPQVLLLDEPTRGVDV
ncbi:MAG: sugar ABC transporter ATP-binding protein, partial [Planctomycetes bacterium]|nr:sugar ABC transporter ATP-binding protein [Planctomycetota bacterium]